MLKAILITILIGGAVLLVGQPSPIPSDQMILGMHAHSIAQLEKANLLERMASVETSVKALIGLLSTCLTLLGVVSGIIISNLKKIRASQHRANNLLVGTAGLMDRVESIEEKVDGLACIERGKQPDCLVN